MTSAAYAESADRVSRWSASSRETKLFGWRGRQEDLRRVVDVDGAIHRRMEDEKGAPQAADALPLVVRAQVVDERTAHLEGAAAQLHFGLALLEKRLEVFAEQSRDVLNVEGRPDGRDRLHAAADRRPQPTPPPRRGCGR